MSETTGLYWSDAKETFDVRLQPGEQLWVRSDWLSQHDGVSKHTSLWWRWDCIGISYASGLVLCTTAINKIDRPALLSLTSSDPEIQIAEIALEPNAEIVLHPRHIVAIQGDISARAVWRLFSWHAWLTGQIRYLIFSGPGSIFVAGPRGIEGFHMKGNKAQRISQSLVVGFDTRLLYSVDRTETFWPYFRGRASLFDDCFEGQGTLLRQNALHRQVQTTAERTFGFLFSALGKLLGF